MKFSLHIRSVFVFWGIFISSLFHIFHIDSRPLCASWQHFSFECMKFFFKNPRLAIISLNFILLCPEDVQLTFNWRSIECQLMFNWRLIECQLTFNWMSIDVQLNVDWRSIECQLTFNLHPIDLQLIADKRIVKEFSQTVKVQEN